MRTRFNSAASAAIIIGIVAMSVSFLSRKAQAQFGQLAVPQSPAFEKAASPLRNHSPRQYDFAKSSLSDVLRLMAEDAGVSFFGLPDGSNGADRLVTFSINASPFSALETLAKANGISLIYDNGIWYLRPADDRELVGRIYEINYNSQETVRKNDQTLSIGGGGGEGSNIGLDLQGSPDFFVREPSRLLEDIRSILDLGTTGSRANIAPNASVDTIGQLSLGNIQGQPSLVVRNPNADLNPQGEDEQSLAKVIWNSDANSLYVVATRQQHQWIEGYLAAADRPQPMIAVQVQFIEISKDPRREFGIDWSGTFQEGRGWGGTMTEAENIVNLDRIGDYSLPTSAILSYDDVNLRLRALFNDMKSKVHSFPRMVTMDNREVSFRSVVNQPVLASSSSASLGAGATESNSVEYIPIGTVINILPKKMANNEMLLNISITVSDIIGERVINGNPFPVATSRVYSAPVTVEDGYSIAISGLDEAAHNEQKTGIPVLGRIPILGHAFKTNQQSRSDQHLLMIITPRLLSNRTPGVNEDGVEYHPWSDNVPREQANHNPVAPIEFRHDPGKNSTFAASTPIEPVTTPIVISQIDQTQPQNRPQRRRLHERLFGKKNQPEPAPVADSNKQERIEVSDVAMDEPISEINPLPQALPVFVADTQDESDPTPTKKVATKVISKSSTPLTETSVPVIASNQQIAKLPLSEVLLPAKESKGEESPKPLPAMIIPDPMPVAEVSPTKVKATNPTPKISAPKIAVVNPNPKPAAKGTIAPQPTTKAKAIPVVTTALTKPRWEGNRLTGGPKAVTGAVDYLKKEFAELDKKSPSSINREGAVKADELYHESARLLSYLQAEDDASGKKAPTFSEEWWQLIELKAKTRRLSQSAFDNIAETPATVASSIDDPSVTPRDIATTVINEFDLK